MTIKLYNINEQSRSLNQIFLLNKMGSKLFFDDEIADRIPRKQLSALLKVSNTLSNSLDLPFILQTAIDSTIDVLVLDTGAIYLLEDNEIFLGATTPPLSPDLQWLLLQPELLQNHPHLQKSLMLRQPIFIQDANEARLSPAEASIRDARHLRSILYIPLLSEGKGIGALIVATTGAVRELSEHEVDLCKVLSSQISFAVTNAKLYKSIYKSHEALLNAYDATLLGWSLALEMRDQETTGHTLRVADITEKVAQKIGIPENERVIIRRGALLHDIGKMSIPDSILNKPGSLTDDEWIIMRKHCDYAWQFLLHIDYLLPALDIPYCHHEKWDGSGYPRGLKGEEIPLYARIFTVVDVFDALTSDRPYRKAWKKEEALQYIREQSEVYFDPRIVDVFLNEL